MTILILTVIVWWITVQAMKPRKLAKVHLPIETDQTHVRNR